MYYDEGELQKEATNKKFLSAQMEGDRIVRRAQDFYNLDRIFYLIFSVTKEIIFSAVEIAFSTSSKDGVKSPSG